MKKEQLFRSVKKNSFLQKIKVFREGERYFRNGENAYTRTTCLALKLSPHRNAYSTTVYLSIRTRWKNNSLSWYRCEMIRNFSHCRALRN
jgi:hypothetical protein